MSTNNNKNIKNNQGKDPKNKKPKKKKKKIKIWRVLLLMLLAAIIITAIVVGVMVIKVIGDAPKIDPTNILGTLPQSSVILDQNGNLVEQIHDANENRDIVKIEKMPKHLQDAFVSIEDKRFETHFGIDIKRIFGALLSNFKSGNLTGQGASTITQQLVKNLYLTGDKALERKIKEAYLAIQMERKLTKSQILENYLNTISLGQSTYGVEAAAYAYFSKNVEDLTIAESASLAAIPKSPTKYAPFNRVSLYNLEGIAEEDIVGYVYIDSIQYACVFNETGLKRQKIVLKEMLNSGKLTQEEYDEAINEDIRTTLKPGQKKIEGITANNFTDYVKKQVIADLMRVHKLTYEEAQSYLYKGGLSIYTTMDVEMQKTIEKTYENFGEILLGKTPPESKPLLQDWRGFRWVGNTGVGTLDKYNNVLNDTGHVLYFEHNNLMDDSNTVYLLPSEYTNDEDGNLIITSKKLNIYTSTLDIVNCYTVDEKNQLVTHNVSGLNIGNNYEIVDKKGTKGTVKIFKEFLDKSPDFFSIDADNVIYINNNYYTYEERGIVQPQSATVILDHRTGQIKALIGGRNIVGSNTFNRAVDSARQPGSTIKPICVYLSAIDHGYTSSSIIDDIPMYNEKGQRWPKNWFEYYNSKPFKYSGLTTIRYSLEQSINTNAVYMYNTLGAETCIDYLSKLGLIDKENPENDTFVTPEENRAYNDINPSSLALGGLTKGFSPLKMAAAYGTIANGGVYTEPISYTKVIDSKGKIIIDNTPKTNVAVAPEVAFIVEDMLRTTVTNGLSSAASLKALGIDMAAKTGTTQNNGDLWCIGFSPYYTASVWVGNDNASMKLSQSSTTTARLLGAIMTTIHSDKQPAKFEVPDGVVQVQVCKQSGKIPTELCSQDPRGSQIVTEYFVKGTEPKETCKTHVSRKVCKDSNLLPNQFCPESSIIDKVFITREVLYNPSLYPDVKNATYEKLLEANKLYLQIKQDIRNGSTEQDILDTYPGLVTLKITNINNNDNNNTKQTIEILSIYGIPVDQLEYRTMFTEDFQYQEPIYPCNVHNYNTWYDSIKDDEDKSDGDENDDEDGDVETPENPDDENQDNNNGNDNDDNNGNGNGNGNNNGDDNSGEEEEPGDDSNIDIITND
ncbi:PBP1A family penicillin-binding protein [Sedimentibacter sp. zth1]|uniref:penicillin-binding protein 1A n=1 Tax=Sedimentibacter sp. zth1 TaxID=2816908 RepID=UPI001A920034|nr:PBP1A family penicillin-binding protein [Sedimentibacter sp. zth1]QSX06391.1 PBP1A family penicillin-binding protein [Sedimentibacter sp. zth1]